MIKFLKISHTTSLSSYITDEALVLLGVQKQEKLITNNITKTAAKKQNLAQVHSRVYAALKEYRLEMAQALGLRAYHIFTDKTLTDLCEQLPMTHIELEQVYGLGPAKVMRFGKDIIKIIRENS